MHSFILTPAFLSPVASDANSFDLKVKTYKLKEQQIVTYNNIMSSLLFFMLIGMLKRSKKRTLCMLFT
jgi:hypothetical protein